MEGNIFWQVLETVQRSTNDRQDKKLLFDFTVSTYLTTVGDEKTYLYVIENSKVDHEQRHKLPVSISNATGRAGKVHWVRILTRKPTRDKRSTERNADFEVQSVTVSSYSASSTRPP